MKKWFETIFTSIVGETLKELFVSAGCIAVGIFLTNYVLNRTFQKTIASKVAIPQTISSNWVFQSFYITTLIAIALCVFFFCFALMSFYLRKKDADDFRKSCSSLENDLVNGKIELQSESVLRIERSKMDLLEHFQLLSVVFKNLFKVKLNKKRIGKGAYSLHIETDLKSRSVTWNDIDITLGDTLWQYLGALDHLLQKFIGRVNKELGSLPKSNRSIPNGNLGVEVSFAGIHFGDPNSEVISNSNSEPTYYECASDDKRGLTQRRARENVNFPPILELVNLPGWCPVSSIVLHITTKKNAYADEALVPEDALLISISDVTTLLSFFPIDYQETDKRPKWDLIPHETLVSNVLNSRCVKIRLPKRWKSARGDSSLMFFSASEHGSSDEGWFNIINGQKITHNEQPHMNHEEVEEVLRYGHKNILNISCDNEGVLLNEINATTETKAFVCRLMKCIYSGLATISIRGLLNISKSHLDTGERYIYYTVPGSTKGCTAAGYFISKSPLPVTTVNELEMLISPLSMIILDSLTSFRRIYFENPAVNHSNPSAAIAVETLSFSRILEKIYKMRDHVRMLAN